MNYEAAHRIHKLVKHLMNAFLSLQLKQKPARRFSLRAPHSHSFSIPHFRPAYFPLTLLPKGNLLDHPTVYFEVNSPAAFRITCPLGQRRGGAAPADKGLSSLDILPRPPRPAKTSPEMI